MKKMIKFNGTNTATSIDEIVAYLLEKGIDVRSFSVTGYHLHTGGRLDGQLIPTKGLILVVYNDEDEQLSRSFYHAKYLAGDGPKF